MRSKSCEILQKRLKLHIASLNIGTMHARDSEVVETLARRGMKSVQSKKHAGEVAQE